MRALALIVLVAGCGSAHRRGSTGHADDPSRLYVETDADGAHGRALRQAAAIGFAEIPFVIPVEAGGDVELRLEVANLQAVGHQTVCKLKILVFRLPQHDLLGIADGAARAAGTRDEAAGDCVETLGATLVSGKVRRLLERRLEAKR